MRLAGVVFSFLLTARNIKIHCRGDEPRSVTIRHDPPRVVYSLCKARIKLKIIKIYIFRCRGSFGTGFDQCRTNISRDQYFRKIDENSENLKMILTKIL